MNTRNKTELLYNKTVNKIDIKPIDDFIQYTGRIPDHSVFLNKISMVYGYKMDALSSAKIIYKLTPGYESFINDFLSNVDVNELVVYKLDTIKVVKPDTKIKSLIVKFSKLPQHVGEIIHKITREYDERINIFEIGYTKAQYCRIDFDDSASIHINTVLKQIILTSQTYDKQTKTFPLKTLEKIWLIQGKEKLVYTNPYL